MKELWQHKVPQGTDVMHEEAIIPTLHSIVSANSRQVKYRDVCAICNKAIIRVDENEGPEALKSLFRF